MNIINKYNINYRNINDTIVVYEPYSLEEINEMFHFRYNEYLKHGYIDANPNLLDIDEYDNVNCYYIVVKSLALKKIIGTVRLIYNIEQLPITKDCFVFNEPWISRIFSKNRKAEISRLIIIPYSDINFLPRHLILFFLMKSVVKFCKSSKISILYAFVKLSLFQKMKSIFVPFIKIKKYSQVYNSGVLKKYFSQIDNPVTPIYFVRLFLNIYLYIIGYRFNKYFKV